MDRLYPFSLVEIEGHPDGLNSPTGPHSVSANPPVDWDRGAELRRAYVTASRVLGRAYQELGRSDGCIGLFPPGRVAGCLHHRSGDGYGFARSTVFQ